ncbi:hypothetical protein ACCS91_40045, partial [Rhizobium ruizarguesonis]
MAQILLRLKAEIKKKLPFNDAPHEGLLKGEKWYQTSYQKYRDQITKWANSAVWVEKTDPDEDGIHPTQPEAA